ncbi:DUF4232 domain-containing protein [Streptomyces indicus]|uniref:DUF4232 domain-containing protein n=1 Tax=Streptomyces indicus TaxID=417292 RepID=A0A1G9CTD5_9ACTN|nr:DUF4232 domain-containing protein [Streptomyces indicus]SDK54725.1 Protein of unknown function [Streptomyces indicus]
MSTRLTRSRLLAATTLAVATLTLTACGGGDGGSVRDEGPGTSAATSAQPDSPMNDNSSGHKDAATGKPATDSSSGSDSDSGRRDSAANGSPSSGGRNSGTSGRSGTSADNGTDSTTDRPTKHPVCDGSTTRTTATEVSRPLNHLLLTVTNTGPGACDLIGYPMARFGEAQAVPPALESTKPQAVITLAPGESGYAGVRLSAADGSGTHGYTARTLTVAFEGGGPVGRPALSGKGVYVDSSLRVTYWQTSIDHALD